MLKMFGIFLLGGACLGPIYGQANQPAASGTAEAVKQLERDWSNAEKTRNLDKLNQIVADDWVGLNSDGTKITKQEFLDGVKSGDIKMESFEIGPMDVKVMGGIAVVQGSDTEKSSFKGKDTSGKSIWMDVFEKHGGKWQAVRSVTAQVK